MIKDYRLILKSQHILTDTRAGKVRETEMLSKVNVND